MDATDFEYEGGKVNDGNTVYPTIEALRKAHHCVEECGIVKVEVQLIQVTQEPKI